MTNITTEFKPVVPAHTKKREFTVRATILGMLLGLLFGVGNAYLGLRLGTTVSASIPAAVVSMTIMRLFFKNVSILENNIVQTIASVGEGLAGGVIFTIPALFFLGDPPSIWHIGLLSFLGGILGVLFMIPMRRYIIVHEHGKLPFPEGTACAEILKSGSSTEPNAILAMGGVVVGAVYKFLMSGFNLWQEAPEWVLRFYQKSVFSIDCTPALMGVGYIIGPRIASVMMVGGVFAWGVLMPVINLFGQNLHAIYPATTPISSMSANDIWSYYIRYIGAGTVAVGGFFGIIHIIPIVIKTFRIGFKELFQFKAPQVAVLRTDRDIPLKFLIMGSALIILFLWLYPGFNMNFLTIILLVILTFFFVGVTSLTVGLVGSTSNPGSGMTLTVLLVTTLVFLLLGWTERVYLIAAMTMGAVSCVAISLAATTSQDLKTGFLVGATPRSQQIAEIVGAILPAAAIGGTLYLLNKAYVFGSEALPAPQATLMALIVKGVMNGELPIVLVSIGVIIGLCLAILKVPILPFALGLYLPLSLSMGTMAGGVVYLLVRKIGGKDSKVAVDRGILASSGMVAGDACMGVVIALLTVVGWLKPINNAVFGSEVTIAVYIILGALVVWFAAKPPFYIRKKK